MVAGSDANSLLTDDKWQFDDTAEMRAVEQLMLSAKVPQLTPTANAPMNLKRTSSDRKSFLCMAVSIVNFKKYIFQI